MKKIGVISDTHGSLSMPAYNALADCDEIIHAGDICDPDILRELRTLAPVHAVLGNIDAPEYGQDVGRFAKPVIDGVRFLVAHKPSNVDISSLGSRALAPGDPIPHVRIHGHTHVPLLLTGKDAAPSQLLMNPGSASCPRGGHPRSIGKIEVDCGRILKAHIEALDGDILFQVEPGKTIREA